MTTRVTALELLGGRRYCFVLVITDVVAPGGGVALVVDVEHCDVRHVAVRRGTVPVLLAGLGPVPVSRLFLVICIRSLLIWRSAPTGEQVQRLLGSRAGLGGVDEHRQAGVGDELHRLEAQDELSYERMPDALRTRVVDPDVVRRPKRSVELAAGRELPDEV